MPTDKSLTIEVLGIIVAILGLAPIVRLAIVGYLAKRLGQLSDDMAAVRERLGNVEGRIGVRVIGSRRGGGSEG